MTVNRLVIAVETVAVALVAVALWFAGSLTANAVESAGAPLPIAALTLFPFLGAASLIAERNHVVAKAQLWHGAVVNSLELRVAELAGGDEDEGVAEDSDLYDEGVEERGETE